MRKRPDMEKKWLSDAGEDNFVVEEVCAEGLVRFLYITNGKHNIRGYTIIDYWDINRNISSDTFRVAAIPTP